MPMPPILPLIDWAHIFETGAAYSEWIAGAENGDHRRQMEEGLSAQGLSAPQEGFLAALPRAVHIIAIAEDWCGDVVRHVPVLERIAQASPKVQVRYITRAQHPEVFARFLTNGGEAIPKFIFLSDAFVECGHWGPMPESCRRIIARGKACGDGRAAREKVSALYAADHDRQEVVRELLELLEIASAERP